jgi:hypothetical protein
MRASLTRIEPSIDSIIASFQDSISQASDEALLSILDRELGDDSASLLIEQLSRGGRSGGASSGEAFQKMRSLLASFRIGLGEK